MPDDARTSNLTRDEIAGINDFLKRMFELTVYVVGCDDRDRTVESRSLSAAFSNSGYFDLVGLIADRDIAPLMDRNDVRAVVVIPAVVTATGTAAYLINKLNRA